MNKLNVIKVSVSDIDRCQTSGHNFGQKYRDYKYQYYYNDCIQLWGKLTRVEIRKKEKTIFYIILFSFLKGSC